MKKTLALALVAAMTISMASMTAFAKEVTYSNEKTDVKVPEQVVATVTVTGDDVKEEKVPKTYKVKVGQTVKDTGLTNADSEGNVTEGKTISADEYAKLADQQSKCEVSDWETKYYTTFGDLKLKKYDSTATKTFFGWAEDDGTGAVDGVTWSGITTDAKKDPDKKGSVLKDSDKIYWVKGTDGKFTSQEFVTVGRTDTDDETIAKNLKAIEDAKNGGDAAQKEKDRLAELDKKYNADGKNGYDKSTKEDKELQGKYTQKKKGDTGVGMDDFYTHAANVAGAPVDETKTWVYDVTLPDGTALYSGKTARTTIELDGVKDSADLSKFGVKVYHIEGWCKATKVKNVDVKGNKVTFWSDSFSPYVITLGDGVASTGADASNPSTGDFSAVPVALLAAAALGATGFVAYKKRKAE
jgi:LPXTG-motif cell wall-anchored protein